MRRVTGSLECSHLAGRLEIPDAMPLPDDRDARVFVSPIGATSPTRQKRSDPGDHEDKATALVIGNVPRDIAFNLPESGAALVQCRVAVSKRYIAESIIYKFATSF
jgi:hypothetical protein